MFIFLSACSLLVPLSMIILGYTWKDKPPKDRQGSSGYRTTMSRMNDETWRYAHRCWGWINFVLGIILVILSIFILILTEYSCAMKSHFRKFGNQMSGSGNHLCNYASLLA